MRDFLSSEDGAVTVDWVVLTAALVGLGLAVMSVISTGLEALSGDIDGALRDDTIIRTSFAPVAAAVTAPPPNQARYDQRLANWAGGFTGSTTEQKAQGVSVTHNNDIRDGLAHIAAGDQATSALYVSLALANEQYAADEGFTIPVDTRTNPDGLRAADLRAAYDARFGS